MKHIFCSLMFVLLSPFLLEAAEVPSLRALGADQSLVVEFSSSGCFHNYTDIIVFTTGKASIYTVESKWSEEKKKQVETGKKHLGIVKLSDDDITKLDALFKFYAGGPDRGCTTVDHITVSLEKDDKVIKTYDFTDGSCDTYEMKSVLTFGALKAKLKK